MLVLVVIATGALFARLEYEKTVVLHLYFLPVVLAGYYVGRTAAGLLALLGVLTVTIVVTLVPHELGAASTPLMIALGLTVWAAALGLTAIMVGTLCDERAASLRELHAAYVGVVEVLAKYLQGGTARTRSRSERIAARCQLVAEAMGLSQREVDDVRVAALLNELGKVEITTQVISRAVDRLENSPARHTFLGTDLVHSLSNVLQSALPLLAVQDEAVHEFLSQERASADSVPIGARILRAVRAYDELAHTCVPTPTPGEALRLLRERVSGLDTEVLLALERELRRETAEQAPVPAFA
jgi:fermentation-respiration switch protein FrsA (DUF1100 family)